MELDLQEWTHGVVLYWARPPNRFLRNIEWSRSVDNDLTANDSRFRAFDVFVCWGNIRSFMSQNVLTFF
jgi:hypothetical protein